MNWEDFLGWLQLNSPFGFEMTYGQLLLSLFKITLTYLAAKSLIWFIGQKVLVRFFKKRNVDLGRQSALRQVVGYIVWSLAVFTILEMLGISNVILASSAALLVGIGLGLQDTFKDLVCGFILLTEGTVEVGDIIEVDGNVAIVRSIGLRTSKAETRDSISILIPNSKLVVDKVINWSHENAPNRFAVRIGVAYGSDLEKVKNILLQAAKQHEKVLDSPAPTVQFKSFGESSLDFELLFYSQEFFRIEDVKSGILFAIDRLFRENNVQVPFPQREVWLREKKVG